MGLSLSSNLLGSLLGVAAALPGWTVSCQWVTLQEERIISDYTVEVRCHTQDGAPVPGVQIGNLESGASGLSDRQGKISFHIEGYEGGAVSFRVQQTPPGMVVADEAAEHRLILKSISGGKPRDPDKPGLLSYDILMRKSRETYVVLVSTRGVGELPVSANGVVVGRLNSRGAGAFRIQGQPREELKVMLRTGQRPELTQENPEQTFSLPPGGGILSFASTLSLLPGASESSADKPIITFVPEKKRRRHRGKKEVAAPAPRHEAPVRLGPVQVPFRGYEVK